MGGHYSRAHHAHLTRIVPGETEEVKRASPAPLTSISFTLNGEGVQVEGARVQTRLVSWLREQPGFTGTKLMCGEGGCGCCVVAAMRVDPVTEKETTIAINSVSSYTQFSLTFDLPGAYIASYALPELACGKYASFLYG